MDVICAKLRLLVSGFENIDSFIGDVTLRYIIHHPGEEIRLIHLLNDAEWSLLRTVIYGAFS